MATIPAFYLALLAFPRATFALPYALAAFVSATALWRGRRFAHRPHQAEPTVTAPRRAYLHLNLLLVGMLMLSAAFPSGDASDLLGVRLFTAVLVILRAGQLFSPRFWRDGIPYLLTLAVGVLGLCGLGFWWLEPGVHSLGDGMWLAFTTAATVGYGDIVPTTAASKIFAVFVVLMGVSALSLVTAAIAAMWVRSGEKRIEADILHDLHRQLKSVHEELTSLKQMMAQRTPPDAPPNTPPRG